MDTFRDSIKKVKNDGKDAEKRGDKGAGGSTDKLAGTSTEAGAGSGEDQPPTGDDKMDERAMTVPVVVSGDNKDNTSTDLGIGTTEDTKEDDKKEDQLQEEESLLSMAASVFSWNLDANRPVGEEKTHPGARPPWRSRGR